jgi:hypothetical protein
MRNVSLLIVIALAMTSATFAHAADTRAVGSSCPVSIGEQRNDALTAGVPGTGRFTFAPGGAGFVDRDGALGIKFAWTRLVKGALIVGGRRLDAEAPSARSYMNRGYGDKGFQPSYLVFPTPGCWRITGRIEGYAPLTFVVFVEQQDEGPAWKFSLPDDGFWYQTTLERGVEASRRGDQK